MALTTGTRLGPYEIVAAIGAGGMGEVYRARDTRLDRQVAIKVLPVAFASDHDRIARFEREAKAVAALSHPNILAIHDIGVQERSSDGSSPRSTYVVTELLDGETLRDRVSKGALPVRKAIDIAAQIARGLAAAHDKGIVHRDLKPENVFVLEDGRIKILDFGLARQTTPGSGATETVAAMTDPGSVMGTVGYMAPEQVRGQTVDARTDLFALGVVLYEMLSGRRAFDRGTAADTLSAVLKEDAPELATLRPDVPPALDRIVKHGLEKNPAERFQSARDVAFALEGLSGSGVALSSVDVVPSRPRRRGRVAALTAVAAVALVGLTVAAVRLFWPAPVAPSWTASRLGGPEIALCPRMSPDGSTLAFIVMEGNMTQVAVMKPESGNWRMLTHKRNAGFVVDLSWSPDSNRIYFDRSADVPMGVFSVSVVGDGDEVLVSGDADSPAVLGDGSLLVERLNAERKKRLFRLWPDTGREQEFPIEPSSTGFMYRAHLIPGDREAAVVGTYVGEGQPPGRHLYVLDLASGRVRRLPSGFDSDDSIGAIAVTPDGQSVLAVGGAGALRAIVAIPADGAGVQRTVLALTMEVMGLDAGPGGWIYADQVDFPSTIVRFSSQGGRAEKIAGFSTAVGRAGMLQDGRFVMALTSGGSRHLTVIEPGKVPRPLIMTQENTSDPVTGVGPSQVAFLIWSESRPTIALAALATGRITSRIAFDKGEVKSLASSADGQTLYVGAGGTIWSLPVAGGEPQKIRAGDSAAVGPPDPSGQHLFVEVTETLRTRLFDVPLDGKPEREIPLNGPFHLTGEPLVASAIDPDSRLFVPLASPDDWFYLPGVVDLATGRMTRIPVDHFGDYHFLLRKPDGQLIAGAWDFRSSLWRFRLKGAR